MYRAVLQVDQSEPEDNVFSRHITQCRAYLNMGDKEYMSKVKRRFINKIF